MKKEEKKLLLKDLCARIPYGVKILHQGWNYEWDQELSTLERVTGIDENFIYTKVIDTHNGEEYRDDEHSISLLDDKPYLFPLSSMTEEKREELRSLLKPSVLKSLDEDESIEFPTLISAKPSVVEIDFYNKYHFDYRGLIPVKLAIDATGLSIYKED